MSQRKAVTLKKAALYRAGDRATKIQIVAELVAFGIGAGKRRYP